MGARQENLINLLKVTSDKVDCEVISKPTLEDYKRSIYYNELLSIYKALNGGQPEIPFNIGKYDCIINGTIVELDEENHFNRYRAITLQATIYKKKNVLNNESYLGYCKLFETKCQARGGYWQNDSSDRQFNNSDIAGSFQSKGSSRWKQRAFYDLLKDHIPFILDIPVKRISIYDTIEVNKIPYTINNILNKGDKAFAPAIFKTIFS